MLISDPPFKFEDGENADLRLFCSGVFVAEKVEGLFVLVDLGESARRLVEAVANAVVVDLRDLADQNLFAARTARNVRRPF